MVNKISYYKDFYEKESKKINEELIIKKTIQEEIDELVKERDNSLKLKDLKNKVSLLLQNVSEEVRKKVKGIIEDVVTSALQSVFKDYYKFIIELKKLGNNPVADFKVITQVNGKELIEDPYYSKGGGVIDVIAITLRIILSESLNEQGFIYFDEPAKMLSAGNINNLGIFIKEITTQFNKQIIINTHSVPLGNCGDIVYSVKKVNGFSQVERTKNLS